MATPDPTPLDALWFTRCPVPTATGIAWKLGWLSDEFAADGITLRTLQESRSELGRHHYDHRLPTLIREGGNMLSIAARAQGEPTRLVGLTWIEESQRILTRTDTGIAAAADLKGRRLALPGWARNDIPSHVRGTSIARGMSLAGYRGALASAGLTLDDVELVEIPDRLGDIGGSGRDSGPRRAGLNKRLWPIEALVSGQVDAIYVKGASALDGAREAGLCVAIDLDALPDRRFRVNNGTPRPITVHQHMLDKHFDVLVRFLAVTLRAAEWIRAEPDKLRAILEFETEGSAGAVDQAYRHLHEGLQPTLDPERLSLLEQQKKFLFTHGFLDSDFALADWIDPRPLEAARALAAQHTRISEAA
ncbi:ABC-type nitrate/sulfonate/bicarbonate transport system substrate-binding protein [Sphingomonas naasensis]|uniref:ABC transporter substrate-binding protein n=1 Tax=Sphingomonas naasensis TaxID=1344951 RepID=A0A4S1WM90_9SPHN|nr:ABC transporter substrate-binding protein [Sphingomonas naasensis]NIJ20248.1 ABC-type nitrate/sulfonate/bicarbonate transport system substrate-binding protein [Sphingomonas naasensis]TGX44389.1 ABC transporter substrate-binding protein [Sphingomonas naasensis]